MNNIESCTTGSGRSPAASEWPTTILQDLQGPKLRIGELENDGPLQVNNGDMLVICTEPVLGTASRISTSYEDLGKDVRIGDTILIDDGLIELRVIDVQVDTIHGGEAITQVIHGGLLKPRKRASTCLAPMSVRRR